MLARSFWSCLVAAGLFLGASSSVAGIARAASDPTKDQTYDATFVDTSGLQTDVTNLVFYWEEELSETQLALHELKHVPVKRGTIPIHVQFDKIKEIEFKRSDGDAQPILSITLRSGQTGEFQLAIVGSFKGQTDFGDMIARPSQLKKIFFK